MARPEDGRNHLQGLSPGAVRTLEVLPIKRSALETEGF